MSKKELKKYILANRHDKEAWEEFRSRPKPNAITIPPDAPPEEFERILREALDQEKI
ncbi:MAG: DUF6887 family protein [Waterburya sp.]